MHAHDNLFLNNSILKDKKETFILTLLFYCICVWPFSYFVLTLVLQQIRKICLFQNVIFLAFCKLIPKSIGKMHQDFNWTIL